MPNAVVGVTGTNGMTTVTELVGHVFRTAGRPVAVAGNVGTPLSSLVDAVDPDAVIACECSSFQLEDATAFAPECAVLLSVTPDHLDRHESFDAYVEAKLRIFANQEPADVAIFDASDPALAGREIPGGARHIDLSAVPVEQLEGTALRGPHNAANARAAAAACLAAGLSTDAVHDGLRTFAGVPHRLEEVARIDGVLYVNDSKATNAAAAAAAVRSFDGGVRVILGGSQKGDTFEALAEPIAECCLACYLIGEAAPRLREDLEPARAAGVEVEMVGDLTAAVQRAAADAGPGEVVLLAPACASFDAYRDFEERGEHFRSLVGELR
jgi:UDP-N-acetylmuramoylalanine--D-glutamate ligase